MSSSIGILFEVPFALEHIRVMCGALTAIDRLYLRAARAARVSVPPLYRAGVRYIRQDPGKQYFLSIADVLRNGGADCKSLAAWRAAELQEAGILAIATPRRVNPHLVHVVVKYPDGRIEDPSKKLGMGKAA